MGAIKGFIRIEVEQDEKWIQMRFKGLNRFRGQSSNRNLPICYALKYGAPDKYFLPIREEHWNQYLQSPFRPSIKDKTVYQQKPDFWNQLKDLVRPAVEVAKIFKVLSPQLRQKVVKRLQETEGTELQAKNPWDNFVNFVADCAYNNFSKAYNRCMERREDAIVDVYAMDSLVPIAEDKNEVIKQASEKKLRSDTIKRLKSKFAEKSKWIEQRNASYTKEKKIFCDYKCRSYFCYYVQSERYWERANKSTQSMSQALKFGMAIDEEGNFFKFVKSKFESMVGDRQHVGIQPQDAKSVVSIANIQNEVYKKGSEQPNVSGYGMKGKSPGQHPQIGSEQPNLSGYGMKGKSPGQHPQIGSEQSRKLREDRRTPGQ